jgi:hypothetical protein
MGTFNKEQFEQSQITGANSTEYVPIPAGEFPAVVEKQAIRVADKGGYVILDITWKIDDATVASETGIANPTIRQSIFLDVNDAGGLEFGKGKNVGLGRLREAVNQNTDGQPWSFQMLVGQVAKIRVDHRADTKTEPGKTIMRSDVGGVTKLA